MTTVHDRVWSLPRPPPWALPLSGLAVLALFALSLPVGFDRTPDVILEGLYLLLAVLVSVPVRRLDTALLDVGWHVFVLGRIVDFLDELFVEPEPIVEPYVSGLLMVVSLSIVVAGIYSLMERQDRRITELRERTEELALKNRVIDEAPIGITVADMTREDEPLVEVNDAFTRTTGYEASETIGRNCRFLQGEDTDPEAVARMRAAIEDGEPVQVTLRNYRKDGTLFWNEVTLAPLPTDGGEPVHYAGFQQDATERKRYERELRSQRDDLDVLNQMLQHDIRNELQLVIANAQLLREHVPEEGRDRVDTIASAAEDAVDLADTAQELSEAMLEPERNRRPVELSAVLRSEIDDAASAFPDASIRLTGDLPVVDVSADGMLGSVFRNLLRNAVQHNPNPEPKVTVSAARTGDIVTVRVADDGPGVPDGLKDDIFARGEKGLESEGTGIGTYLVDTLVTRYGGEVWIEDNDPEGAVFAVRLPVADAGD